MRAARTAAVAAVLAASTFASAASGAARTCNLVVDRTGDQVHPLSDTGVQLMSDDLDVVGADVATSRKYVTGVIRLVSLRETDLDAPTGRAYAVAFTVGGHRYSMRATYGPDGYSASAWDEDTGTGIGDAAVVFDHAKREVRLTTWAATFGIVPGSRLSQIGVVTGQRYGTNGGRGVSAGVGPGVWAGGGGMTQETDYATGSRDYVAGTPSCVTAGR